NQSSRPVRSSHTSAALVCRAAGRFAAAFRPPPCFPRRSVGCTTKYTTRSGPLRSSAFRVLRFDFRVLSSRTGSAAQEFLAGGTEILDFAVGAVGLAGVAAAPTVPNQPVAEEGPRFA